MNKISSLVGFIILGLPCICAAQVVLGDAAVQSQWFTGSLESPSPALPKAGILAIEPYFIYTHITGLYDSSGDQHSVSNAGDQFATVVLLKYAVTDRISIQGIPLIAHAWNDQSTATGIGDLPVEIQYRFNDENNKTGFPSVTASLGVNLPTGDYDRLHSSLDGLGSGAYTVKQGLLAQSLFDTWGHHPMRLRFYGSLFETVADVPVNGLSVYGTNQGFSGHASPHVASQVGIGVGYGLDQRWVLAFDLVQNWANGFHLRGSNAGVSVDTYLPSSAKTSLATAVEYNLSSSIGVIAGVEFSVAGRNSSSYLAPQLAVSMSF